MDKSVTFHDGVRRELYENGDVVEIFPDGSVLFSYKSGVRIFKRIGGYCVGCYPNGDMLEINEDGSRRITYKGGKVVDVPRGM